MARGFFGVGFVAARRSPAVVPLAVGLAVAQEARAGLVQRLPALGALEAGDVPLQVRRHPQQERVLDAAPAARAQGQPRPPCRSERVTVSTARSAAGRRERGHETGGKEEKCGQGKGRKGEGEAWPGKGKDGRKAESGGRRSEKLKEKLEGGKGPREEK